MPDLQSCSAFGDTPAEALAEIEQAIEAWLAVAREDVWLWLQPVSLVSQANVSDGWQAEFGLTSPGRRAVVAMPSGRTTGDFVTRHYNLQ